MVDARRYAASAFITVEDIRGASGPANKTITAVTIGQYDKLNALFDDGTTLSLNKTNTRTMVLHYGADTEDWIEHVVALSIGPVEYRGQPQDAVIVTPVSKPSKPPVFKPLPPEPVTVPDDDMGGDGIPF